MKLNDEVKIVFQNSEGKKAEITITVKQLLESTTEDFHEWLDNSEPCTSASCNNESQNFCDCGSSFEDYEIIEVLNSQDVNFQNVKSDPVNFKEKRYTKKQMLAFAENCMLKLLSTKANDSQYPEISSFDLTRIKQTLSTHK